MFFRQYPGPHWMLECERFGVVYQFSDTQVRIKGLRLREDDDE